MKDVLKVIKSRRSVRRFKNKPVSKRFINKALEAAGWAPSGLNNQPWRFMVLVDNQKDALAHYTHYSRILLSADKAILVFLDKKESYNLEKDLMAVGAAIQNILLYLHSRDFGACWLGEILKNRDKVQKLLKTPENLRLEAVIAVGKPLKRSKKGKRKSLKNLMIP